jgi:hypothetical protein
MKRLLALTTPNPSSERRGTAARNDFSHILYKERTKGNLLIDTN